MKRWADLCSLACGLIAAVFLSGMLLLTVADVALRALVQLSDARRLRADRALARRHVFSSHCPAVFLRDDNILVNTIDDFAPRIVPLSEALRAGCLSVAVLAVLVWQGWFAAMDSYEFNDVTADLGLPRFWHWTIVLTGMVGRARGTVHAASWR